MHIRFVCFRHHLLSLLKAGKELKAYPLISLAQPWELFNPNMDAIFLKLFQLFQDLSERICRNEILIILPIVDADSRSRRFETTWERPSVSFTINLLVCDDLYGTYVRKLPELRSFSRKVWNVAEFRITRYQYSGLHFLSWLLQDFISRYYFWVSASILCILR